MNFNKIHSAKEVNIFTDIGNHSRLHSAINLAQNAPDFPMDSRLSQFLKESAEKDFKKFASAPALPILIENILQFNKRRENPLFITEKEISIIPGATYGLHIAMQALVQENDEVIIIEPCYETYLPLVEMRKAKPIFISSKDNSPLEWSVLEDSITEKTRVIIVNFPHNPTGKIWNKEDWDTLWELIKDRNIVILSDEVYDVLVFDDHQFYSAYHHPEIKERCVCLFSLEKMFYLFGWKTSYILASEKLTAHLQSVHQYICFTTNLHAQYALAKFLEIFDEKENRIYFQNKRDYFLTLMEDVPFTISEKAKSGYAQTFDFTNINSKISDKDFSLLLIEKAKVATIPYSAFYHDEKNTGKLRISFAKKDETLEEAVANLRKYFC
ncbi:aminotransferase class I/II-fold pyridoxal phosphate-dependent enzyme [Frigoriflavimonas asaccharolytica]|uniref:Methionine aminotransferase n=1 Tax=Frigoriflavimonas asaccharolytica TaxID=2735899 RepID=A0A8J8G917_9FLAO|nr:aminotransferase class I/II-fold pyridoxal phosphate-dependent enzyme [Frigoriflavimonas asaccharolytica]NRS91510.1 methionine aminotransferase [Frigoriflavimonas asaccharolytica]